MKSKNVRRAIRWTDVPVKDVVDPEAVHGGSGNRMVDEQHRPLLAVRGECIERRPQKRTVVEQFVPVEARRARTGRPYLGRNLDFGAGSSRLSRIVFIAVSTTMPRWMFAAPPRRARSGAGRSA